MGVLNQSDIIDRPGARVGALRTLGDPAAGDRCRYRVLSGFGGAGVFDADFHSFEFAPHSHETLTLCLVLAGVKRFARGRAGHCAGAGAILVVNAGDTHSGGVAGAGRRLRSVSVYPSAGLLEAAGMSAEAGFRSAAIEDGALSRRFAAALSPAADAAEAEEALLRALAALGARHGGAPDARDVDAPRAVAAAIDFVESRLEEPLRLEAIAHVAGVGPRQLIRAFRRGLGMTPLQYVRQARVRAVCARLRRGESLAAAAAATGFADQPHMTRSFRAVMGVTPFVYAAGWRAAAPIKR